MSILIDKNGPIIDQWLWMDDKQPLPNQSKLIVSASCWRARRPSLLAAKGPLAIVLQADTDMAELQSDFVRFDLIIIQFGVFGDGRGFSQARLLRERYAYTKPIRAIGDVQRDQLAFMARCGITQFELGDVREAASAQRAFAEISVDYQAGFLRKAN